MPFLDNNVSLVPSECIKMEATATQGQPLTLSYVFFCGAVAWHLFGKKK